MECEESVNEKILPSEKLSISERANLCIKCVLHKHFSSSLNFIINELRVNRISGLFFFFLYREM